MQRQPDYREFHIPWEHAFDKFGFGDGAYSVTDFISDSLTNAGYEVESQIYGLHNDVIISIARDGRELMPIDDPNIVIGYTHPRAYLPQEIIQILDEEFG